MIKRSSHTNWRVALWLIWSSLFVEEAWWVDCVFDLFVVQFRGSNPFGWILFTLRCHWFHPIQPVIAFVYNAWPCDTGMPGRKANACHHPIVTDNKESGVHKTSVEGNRVGHNRWNWFVVMHFKSRLTLDSPMFPHTAIKFPLVSWTHFIL